MKYEELHIEIETFEEEDVITASGDDTAGDAQLR